MPDIGAMSPPTALSRRKFLKWAPAGLIAAPGVMRFLLSPRAARAADGERRGVVVRILSEEVWTGRQVRPKVLAEMFSRGLRNLCPAASDAEAWRSLLDPADIIGLKFDPLCGHELGTAAPLGSAVIASLLACGWSADQLVIANDPQDLVEQYGVRPMDHGWARAPIEVGGRREYLAAFVEQVTAIINLPSLKNDNIFALSGCVKSISYDLVRHPARYHARGGEDLGGIAAQPAVAGKVRLNVLNGLRVVYDGGPLLSADHLHASAQILLGLDPAAVDTLGLELLNSVRVLHGLPAVASEAAAVPALRSAARHGGIIDLRRIDRRLVTTT